jgi:Protein of unknown function (DUF2510)
VHYAGNGSWVVAIPFLIMFALRFAGGNRRRTGAPGPRPPLPGTSIPLVEAPPASDAGSPSVPSSASRTSPIGRSGVAAGWLADPSGRHELRYWSGTQWTEHVSDSGAPGTDPWASHGPIEPE